MDQKRKQYQNERYLWLVYSAEYPSRNEIQVQKRFPDKSESVELYFLLQISAGYEKNAEIENTWTGYCFELLYIFKGALIANTV